MKMHKNSVRYSLPLSLLLMVCTSNTLLFGMAADPEPHPRPGFTNLECNGQTVNHFDRFYNDNMHGNSYHSTTYVMDPHIRLKHESIAGYLGSFGQNLVDGSLNGAHKGAEAIVSSSLLNLYAWLLHKVIGGSRAVDDHNPNVISVDKQELDELMNVLQTALTENKKLKEQLAKTQATEQKN